MARPVSFDSHVTATVSTPYVFSISDFRSDDPDGDPITEIRIRDLPDHGTLALDGAPITSSSFSISLNDILLGKLTYTPAANGAGGHFDELDFGVVDETGETSFSDTVSITVAPPGTPAGEAIDFGVNSFTDFAQDDPALSPLKDGGFIAVWMSDRQDGDEGGIFAQRFDAGGSPIGDEFQVNTETDNYQSRPDVTTLEDGSYVVTWDSAAQDGSGAGVFAQRFSPDGAPLGGEFQVNSETSSDQYNAAITALDGGGYVVTWESFEQDGDESGIFGQVFNTAGDRVGSEFQVNSTTIDNQDAPEVAALSDGGFVVTWDSFSDAGQNDIMAQRFNASGVAQGGEVAVAAGSTDQYSPDVTGLSDGRYVVTWSHGGEVAARIFSADGTLQKSFFVNTHTENAQENPAITTLEDGGFLISWQSFDQGNHFDWAVFGQRYDANGNPVGGEFRIGTEIFEDSFNPSIAALDGGGFAVGFESDSEIRARVFEENVQVGTSGADSQVARDDNDALMASPGADTLDGGEGRDAVLFGLSEAGVVVNLATGVARRGDAQGDSLRNIEDLSGSGFGDRLRGSSADNTLSGLGGDDTLVGQEGEDLAYGGDGNDKIFAGPDDLSSDLFAGGDGNDLIAGGAGQDLIVGDHASTAGSGQSTPAADGADTLFGGAGNDTVIGGAWFDVNNNGQYDNGEESLINLGATRTFNGNGNDLVFGAAGDDVIGGGTGNDTLVGGDGADTFFGGRGANVQNRDVINAGAGNDTVFAGSDDDSLSGGDGDDDLFAGGGNDSVRGGAGDDSLFGGAGDDRLVGGTGSDNFFFADNHGSDTITDFSFDDDVLYLANVSAGFADLRAVIDASTIVERGDTAGLLIDTGGGNEVFIANINADLLTQDNVVI
ncbi:calcium-binding protein [Yunchengibacter salinarum]|uniref:calcium-binding protein n=1 Tax=Yunchengibacter salinarum TaxID=3133399 RepID=UPI0035B69B53